jgi:GNAT superfamily N-acetyltransferase
MGPRPRREHLAACCQVWRETSADLGDDRLDPGGAQQRCGAHPRPRARRRKRFVDIGLDSIAGDEPTSTALLRTHIDASTAWVAVDDIDRIVGAAWASIVDGEGHLDQLSVAVDTGRRGVGRALIEQVCTWAAAEGLDAVTLTTFRDVPFNGPFYERCGFRVIDPDLYGPQLAAIRQLECDRGIDVVPRVAMRRRLER